MLKNSGCDTRLFRMHLKLEVRIWRMRKTILENSIKMELKFNFEGVKLDFYPLGADLAKILVSWPFRLCKQIYLGCISSLK